MMIGGAAQSGRGAWALRCVLAPLLILGALGLPLGAQDAPSPVPAPAPSPVQAMVEVPRVSPVPPEIVSEMARLGRSLAEIDQLIGRARDRDEDLVALRARVEQEQAGAARILEDLQPKQQAAKDQLGQLGPAPAKDQPAEAPGIARERSRITTDLAELDAVMRQGELINVRGRQLIARIQDLRRDVFTRDLLRRTESPLNPKTWIEVANEWPLAQQQLAAIGQSWFSRLASHAAGVFLVLGAAVLAGFAVSRLVRRLALRWHRMNVGPQPTFFQRASVGAVLAPARAAPGLVAAGVLYSGALLLDLFGGATARIAESVLLAFVAYTVVSALAYALLEPRLPRWRLVDLDTRSARRLSALTRATGAVYAVDLVLQDLIRLLNLSLPASIAATFIASVAFAGLLIAMVATPFQPADPAEPPVSPYRPRWIKVPLLALAIGVIAISVLGYVALGRVIAGHVLLTGSGLILVLLLHLAIRAFCEHATNPDRRLGRLMTERLGLAERRRAQTGTALSLVLNALLAAVAGPMLLIAWGFSPPEILRGAQAAVFGFEIGQFRISLARILIALGLFLGVIFLTRLLQQWMQASVFPSAKLDTGVANSIEKGIGYAGFALAAVAAISYAGFDISNLAIVAGALSVGIGFGLQSIVNNFVSGLILLVERPIKVGDWIVLKDHQGIVRNISVRSTEIETFDRSSLIVPNSELISGSVLNWTHRNSVGRLVIKVGVDYDCDPELVRKLLLDIAERNVKVLSHPKPQAVLDDLGNFAMDFSLRVFLADVGTILDAQTEIRMEIVRTFKAHGIQIPYPQYDVRLKPADDVGASVAAVADQAPVKLAQG